MRMNESPPCRCTQYIKPGDRQAAGSGAGTTTGATGATLRQLLVRTARWKLTYKCVRLPTKTPPQATGRPYTAPRKLAILRASVSEKRLTRDAKGLSGHDL